MINKITYFLLLSLWSVLFLPTAQAGDTAKGLQIGWAGTDITPDQPVLLAGQFYARVSEGVIDPVTATALALESPGDNTSLVMVSCDLVSIHESLLESVRECLRRDLPELDSECVLLFATHTHTAPLPRDLSDSDYGDLPCYGIELPAMDPAEYVAWAAEQIAGIVQQAWTTRAAGEIAYGLGHAVVGRNRLMAYTSGRSRMYGPEDTPEFSHMEGYEDHSLNVLATYDQEQQLTGLIVNLACPAQSDGSAFRITADFWHETRQELRQRLGEKLFVLPQCSAAGDQSPTILINRRAETRMRYLAGQTPRQIIAARIADGITSILPIIEKQIDAAPQLRHRQATVELPRRLLDERDRDTALRQAEKHRLIYEDMLRDLEANPAKRLEKHWYKAISTNYRRMLWHDQAVKRFELQHTQPTLPVELHVIRLGNVAFASNPFELYLDFGLQIQARAKAVQTFIIQLAGSGSYLPTERSIAGGAYGAIPASTQIGPEGGRELVNWTVDAINEFWE